MLTEVNAKMALNYWIFNIIAVLFGLEYPKQAVSRQSAFLLADKI